MAGSRRPPLLLTVEEKRRLDELRGSQTAALRDVRRARILWRYHAGETISGIARELKTTRPSVLKWIDKALQMGVKAGMQDTPHKPREAVITDDAKTWVVHLACCKPKDLGYAAELWTRSALARHVRNKAAQAGYPALAKAGKATVQRILASQPLHPQKVKYYLERRDPLFEQKMREVLLVYREVQMQNEAGGKSGPGPTVITVSVDEKPGVQAIGNTAPDLPPVAGKYPLSPAIMNTYALVPGRFWPHWTCMTGMSSREWRSVIEVRSSSHCSRSWIRTIRAVAPSG